MVVFGRVLDDTGSWGLGVIEAEDEQELRAFAAGDPAVSTGTATIEIGKMLAGFVAAEAGAEMWAVARPIGVPPT